MESSRGRTRERSDSASTTSFGISWYAGKRPVEAFEKTSEPSTVISKRPPLLSTFSMVTPGKASVSSAARPAACGA